MEKENKLYTVLRWIGVLPLSFAAMFLANIFSRIFTNYELNYLGIYDPESFMYILFEYIQFQVLGNIFICAAFVLVGYFIAPKHNKIIGLILMIFGLCFTSVSLFIENAINGNYIGSIPLIASMIGFVVGYLFIFEKEKSVL